MGRNGPGEQAAAGDQRRRSHLGHGPTFCPPRRAALGPRLRPTLSHGWLSSVPDGLADPLWVLGAAATSPGQRACAEAALDAYAAAALCPGRQDGAAPAPSAGASPRGVWHTGDRQRSEERRVGKSVDLGGRRIIK